MIGSDPTLFKEDQVRLAHLQAIQRAGLNPYPATGERTHTLAEARQAPAGATVKVAGRLMAKREMGKLCFGELQDASGRLQIALASPTLAKEDYQFWLKNFEVGDWVGVSGEMFTTKKGEITVRVNHYTMLAKALLPLPEKWHGLTDVEARFRKRYLDLIMNETVRERLRTRSRIIAALRQLLDRQGFLEIETPTLQPVYGGGFARPFITHHQALGADFFLRISDEMYLKRAIIGGLEKVYEITKVFRNEGIDRDHNPEFTMLEAQIAYADYRYGMDLFEEIFESCAQSVLGTTQIKHNELTVELARPWRRLTLVEAVRTIGQVNFDLAGNAAEAKTALQPRITDSKKQQELNAKNSAGEILALAFEELVEEQLIQPTIIYDYPVEVSPLAKRGADPRFTERFEAFALGSEIGNNYSELNDPLDLEQRFIAEKKRAGAGLGEAHQTDTDYLEAVKHGMPPACGLGIGIDRMVMLFTGANNIKEVIMFPTLRPESKPE
ncbi:MAG: lysine--tRNA ligase [Candidatus Magasanikbacteria bacterium]|nr:lysine--tRNA ligase [Candidatus Magasanikbacteria bacterium]